VRAQVDLGVLIDEALKLAEIHKNQRVISRPFMPVEGRAGRVPVPLLRCYTVAPEAQST
jgi:hypothetical protein